MNVFVIGGTGLFGWHAVLELCTHGHKVRILARRPRKNSDILDKPLNTPLVGSLETNAHEGLTKMSGFIVTLHKGAPYLMGLPS